MKPQANLFCLNATENCLSFQNLLKNFNLWISVMNVLIYLRNNWSLLNSMTSNKHNLINLNVRTGEKNRTWQWKKNFKIRQNCKTIKKEHNNLSHCFLQLLLVLKINFSEKRFFSDQVRFAFHIIKIEIRHTYIIQQRMPCKLSQ